MKNSCILYIFRFLTNPRHRVGMRFMRKRDLQPQGPSSILSREFLTFYQWRLKTTTQTFFKCLKTGLRRSQKRHLHRLPSHPLFGRFSDLQVLQWCSFLFQSVPGSLRSGREDILGAWYPFLPNYCDEFVQSSLISQLWCPGRKTQKLWG